MTLRIQDTNISQYANSPTLVQLIDNVGYYLSQDANMDDFYNLVWNVLTAQGWGLDVWGRIVGVGRVYPITDVHYFGFDEQTGALSFNEGAFWTGSPATVNYSLSDDAYRQLILTKAAANITDGSIPALNQLVLNMFAGRGDSYVEDLGGMAMRYTFDFAFTPVDVTLVVNSGVLPHPSGVAVSYSYL